MTYADFDYYQVEFHGVAIMEEDFSRYALQASRFLDYYTWNKAKRSPELPELKDACCALAEQYQLMDQARQAIAKSLTASAESAGKELQSETVGPWTKTYKSGGDSAAAAVAMQADFERSMSDIARRYLAHTGLLYRGGRCGRCSHTL